MVLILRHQAFLLFRRNDLVVHTVERDGRGGVDRVSAIQGQHQDHAGQPPEEGRATRHGDIRSKPGNNLTAVQSCRRPGHLVAEVHAPIVGNPPFGVEPRVIHPELGAEDLEPPDGNRTSGVEVCVRKYILRARGLVPEHVNQRIEVVLRHRKHCGRRVLSLDFRRWYHERR